MRTTEVEVSGRLALACGGCGEVILFLGRERDWYELAARVAISNACCRSRVRHASSLGRP